MSQNSRAGARIPEVEGRPGGGSAKTAINGSFFIYSLQYVCLQARNILTGLQQSLLTRLRQLLRGERSKLDISSPV